MTVKRSFWPLFARRNDLSHTASELYGHLVAQARQPAFYSEWGTPDTPEGRLELIVLHVVLVLRHLRRQGEQGQPLARALAETFVRDMDDCLREMGVGDISVAKKVNKAAAALFDRSRDYGAALDAGDEAGLARLIGRHVLEVASDAMPPAASAMAAYAIQTEKQLEAVDTEALSAGRFSIPAVTRQEGR
jgi:cytochrome b pre-mRNA-processing protein 3